MRVLEERGMGQVHITPNAAKRFADALLGRTTSYDVRIADADDGVVAGPLKTKRTRLIEHFRWLTAIMPSRAGLYQQQLEQRLAEEESAPSESSTFAALLLEGEWDASKHPRRGTPPNGGWFAAKGTGTTATGGVGAASGKGLRVAPVNFKSGIPKPPVNKGTLNDLVNRQREIDRIAGGGPSRQTMRAQGIAGKITSAGKLPGAVAGGLGSGLKTGGKSLINGGATAVKNVATLGLSTEQLELIGVTEEDRANGYHTAVFIATGSGEVLIAVGTGGLAAALKAGGTVARAVNGALIVHDVAGSAVGVVQGIYDAKENGFTVSGGVSIAASALGVSSNVRELSNAAKQAPSAPNVSAAKGANVVPQQPSKGVGHQPTPKAVKAFVDKLPRKKTPTNTPANRYEIKYTGPENYVVSGGGKKAEIDGYDGTTILEAKHVEKSSISPYIPTSNIPQQIRDSILAEIRDQMNRLKAIIESGETPFQRVEIITNTEESKAFFQGMLRECGVPGSVRLGEE